MLGADPLVGAGLLAMTLVQPPPMFGFYSKLIG